MALLIHDPLTRLIAQIAAIVVTARLLGVVARRLGQPRVIAEITAGIVLGPSLLGWLAPESAAALFAPESLRILHLVSQVGLILFMFLIGLELDPTLLRGRGRGAIAIAQASIAVPLLLGLLLAIRIHPDVSSAAVPVSSFALFLGAAMSVTAFPVLAYILAERGLLRSPIGAMAIACAAVADVTAWCLLAFVVATVRATGWAPALSTTVLTGAFVAVMLFGVRPLLARLIARAGTGEGLTQDVVAAIIVLLLVASWTTELIGIHALFGAFLFGGIVPKEGGFARALAGKIEDLVMVILLPLFFAYSGVRTHIGLLDSAASWWTCGLIVLVACLGKFGGCAAAARLAGLDWREAGALGVLMNTRGLMELIVLNIGLDLGVITPTLFTMMVLMAVFTTFATTPVLQMIYPAAALAQERGVSAEQPPPSPRPPAFTVLICVAYDRSGPGLLTLAAALCGPRNGNIYALQLVRPTERSSSYLGQTPEVAAETTLAPLQERATEIEVSVSPLAFISSDPAHDICHVARVKGADLVLMGWHKPLLHRSRLGGTVYRVMREAPSDVGVFIDRGLAGVRRVLVPFLGSPHDRAALALGRRTLAQEGAEVTILHVVQPRQTGPSAAAVRHDVDQLLTEPEGGRVRFRIVEHQSPADAALEESREGYDLVIIGIGREWGLPERQFGIQPERLMRECQTSLLVVHHRGVEA